MIPRSKSLSFVAEKMSDKVPTSRFWENGIVEL